MSNEQPDHGAALEPAPHSWPWAFFCLFLRPAEFFRDYVLRPVPLLTVVAAWTYGIAAVMDRIEQELLKEGLGGRQMPLEDLAASWSVYWGVCLAGGALSGFFYYYLGGWWYRVRLRWSGVADPDRRLARRVYLYAAQAYSIPAILYVAWETLAYRSPRAAFSGEDLGSLLVLICLAWSLYVSYRGASVAFQVRPWPARIWFLVLPAILYTAVIGAVFAVALFTSLLDRPHVNHPLTLSDTLYRFEYPRNWIVEHEEGIEEPGADLTVSPPLADATLRLWVYPFPVDPAEEIEVTRESLEEVEILATRPIDTWGHHQGRGAIHDARIDGAPYRLISFCATTDEAAFEILQIAEENLADTLEPGFALIRDSFVLAPPP